jgi:hypothetical protein
MPKTLVGKVKNERFAFFWLLIGGSIGDLFPAIYAPGVWQLFLPPAILSLVIAMVMFGNKRRPKILLGADLLISIALLALLVLSFGTSPRELPALIPDAMIIFGCILGVCNW